MWVFKSINEKITSLENLPSNLVLFKGFQYKKTIKQDHKIKKDLLMIKVLFRMHHLLSRRNNDG